MNHMEKNIILFVTIKMASKIKAPLMLMEPLMLVQRSDKKNDPVLRMTLAPLHIYNAQPSSIDEDQTGKSK